MEKEGFLDGVNSLLIGDGTTGEIYYAYDEEESFAIASTTKLITYFVLMDAVKAGEITLDDILKELQKPARDSRESMPAPVLRSDVLDMIDTYVKGIWDSVEAQKGALQSIIDKPAGGRESDEMRAAVAEIASSVEEIRTGLRSVQNVQSESKDTLKTSLDSAIYGLKQDNREIVEFVQRMNTNLMASVNDPDKDKKEEEAVAKEEARKQEIEERFKQTEDFMHKESVKVYRNVQAVVNEKMDRHADNVELGNKQLVAQVAQVKTVAVIAALLSGIDIIINVLKIFGII